MLFTELSSYFSHQYSGKQQWSISAWQLELTPKSPNKRKACNIYVLTNKLIVRRGNCADVLRVHHFSFTLVEQSLLEIVCSRSTACCTLCSLGCMVQVWFCREAWILVYMYVQGQHVALKSDVMESCGCDKNYDEGQPIRALERKRRSANDAACQ